jgi:hypothetical protein
MHGHMNVKFDSNISPQGSDLNDRYTAGCNRESRIPKQKSKRVPSIFKDESTGSSICLRLLIYMLHVLQHTFQSVLFIVFRLLLLFS